MKQDAYTLIINYLRIQNKGISPKELSVVLKRSRVTIQSALKRLVQNGWVKKDGRSPKVYYSAVNLTLGPELNDLTPGWDDLDAPEFQTFIDWCKDKKYHVPERLEEYKKYLIKESLL